MVSAATLSAWYREHARPVLVHAGHEIVEELEQACTKDGPALDLAVCVAGVAGVGKSTLLDTVVSDRLSLLPRGGAGSYTAAPVRIVHAHEPYLAIRRDRAVATSLLAELSRGPSPSVASLHHARLLVRGTQFDDASPAYLADVLGAAVRGRLSERAVSRDRGRLAVLANVLTDPRPAAWITWDAGSQLPELRHELEHNAAGFLSPLVSEVELGWSADALEALQLVDLPGLGVVHDVLHRRTMSDLTRARAALLVVDRSGITEAVAAAVRPIVERLALDANRGVVRVVVAITQLDQGACERRACDRRPWRVHFDELGAAACTLVRAQLGQQLAAVGLRGEARRAERMALAARVPVIHVAPLEHRRYHRRDPEERCRIAGEDESGIPRLRRTLAALGTAWLGSQRARLVAALGHTLGLHGDQVAELHGVLQLGITPTHENDHEEVT